MGPRGREKGRRRSGCVVHFRTGAQPSRDREGLTHQTGRRSILLGGSRPFTWLRDWRLACRTALSGPSCLLAPSRPMLARTSIASGNRPHFFCRSRARDRVTPGISHASHLGVGEGGGWMDGEISGKVRAMGRKVRSACMSPLSLHRGTLYCPAACQACTSIPHTSSSAS